MPTRADPTRPDPTRPDPIAAPPLADLAASLRREGVTAALDSSELTRALYSSDASLYRVVPQAVVAPHDAEEVAAVVRVAAEHRVPVTSRGAGTSCAGNAVGPGVVVDFSRHLNQVLAVDPEARTARVQPGVVQASLQRAAAPYGLRFGPDPSTQNRCTIGGMIGNNACGPRALGYGRTADNVVALSVVTGRGEAVRVGEGDPPASLEPLRGLVQSHLGLIRTEFGRFGRQVSGYSLEHLLPERHFNLPRFLAGTEGTLAVSTEATVRLVHDAPYQVMVALGYPTMADAADATPALLAAGPTAIEGLGRRMVEVLTRERGPGAVPPLPRGDGWVFVELVGDDPGALVTAGQRLLAESDCLEGAVVADPAQAAALWKIRADGAGLAEVSLARPAYGGWEDSAVPPEQLGRYLRELERLLADHGLSGLPYGHFGDGCVHIRIDYPLAEAGGAAVYRSFVEQAADLVATFGGSMSGEHGDGRARSELLPRMYSPAALAVFGQVKAVFDPGNVLNPGVLVDPDPLDAALRTPAAARAPLALAAPRFAAAVHRCSGVGKCVADTTATGGVMCPSYVATRQEKDSTRGRARVLQEMINGSLVEQGWRSPAVHAALDLCLSCKGCARDCPKGVDMASYKSEVIDRSYRRRLRPRAHYALGWLPRWGRLITRVRGLGALANLTTQTPGLRRLVRWSAGVDQRRSLPKFARRSARDRVAIPEVAGVPAVIWVDSFSDCFPGEQVAAVVRVLANAGYAPRLLDRRACCGLTWISTGQRDGARRQLRASLDVLHPLVAAGTPVVGLEPSCLAVWRSDAAELLPDDPRVPDVAAGISTLAELLARTEGWQPPNLTGTEVVVQPHCHHASVLSWQPDAALLARTGATVTTLGGCCGLAGNFGVEQGHYEVSVKIAEHDLLPAVRAHPEAVVLADGFSCRTQLAELTARPGEQTRQAITLAELLAR